MTGEPIKLPPDLLAHVLVREGVNKHRARDIEQWMNEQMRLAVEQATADLRAELASVLADWNDLVKAIGSPTNGGAVGYAKNLRGERDDALAAAKEAEAERDEARHTSKGWYETALDNARDWDKALAERDEARAELARLTTLPTTYWDGTPLPEPKEADK